jgi:phytoene dehydrogenase-like protein
MALMEAFVVGSGPNGLAAALVLAHAGARVTVLEAEATPGGGTRSAESTLPGFMHDICSAVHPMALSSPFFRSLPLHEHGLEWIHPPIPFAHPMPHGRVVVARRSVADTARDLGRDGPVYRKLLGPFTDCWNQLADDILAPPHTPRNPLPFAQFGALSALPAAATARLLFRTDPARALFAGAAAHSILPLHVLPSAAFGWIMLITAHAVGWPIARGGSRSIAAALISLLESQGGQVLTGKPVRSLDEFPPRALVLCDITPRQLLQIAGRRLPDAYARKLKRYRYGPGVFRIDWALDAPIPWPNSESRQAGTLHLGGPMKEIAASERAAWRHQHLARPFVLLSQPSLFDPTRAPAGKHTAWAYCHVPNGSTEDRTAVIEDQVERFAPGFRRHILARYVMNTAHLEMHNANLVGGDITGGAATVPQLLFRPTANHYRTPVRGLYLCSASTPPGAGVHGMCGYYAAKAALEDWKR